MTYISRSSVWFKITRPPSNFSPCNFFNTVSTNCSQVSYSSIVEITINVIHQQLTGKSCSKPASVTCGFFLVARRFPAWFSRLDSSTPALASLASTAIVCCIFLNIIHSTWALITGFAYGSHGVFSAWTLGKGQCKLGFFGYANKYQ
jgi:hypothetical protein